MARSTPRSRRARTSRCRLSMAACGMPVSAASRTGDLPLSEPTPRANAPPANRCPSGHRSAVPEITRRLGSVFERQREVLGGSRVAGRLLDRVGPSEREMRRLVAHDRPQLVQTGPVREDPDDVGPVRRERALEAVARPEIAAARRPCRRRRCRRAGRQAPGRRRPAPSARPRRSLEAGSRSGPGPTGCGRRAGRTGRSPERPPGRSRTFHRPS